MFIYLLYRICSLKPQFSSTCAALQNSFDNSLSSLSAEVKSLNEKVNHACSSTHVGVGSSIEPSSEILYNSKVKSENIDRSASVVFFGLPEDSLIKTREIVDEISNFLLGSVAGVKDLFRVGESAPTIPILVVGQQL